MLLSEDLAGNTGHFGRIKTQQILLFGQYGVNSRINLIASLPVIHWSQFAEDEDAHHRTETLWGFQDLNLGARYIISNSYFGPGSRIFAGVNLSVPTAPSYKRGFPYLTIRYRWEGTDHWAGQPAPNSGGYFLDVSAGLDLELSEKISGVVRFHTPLWTQADGSQQSSSGLEINFRFVKP